MKIEKDKLQHLTVCAIASAIITAVVSWAGASLAGASLFACFVAGFLGGSAIGIGKEYGDSKAQGNCWSWGDIVADEAGAVLGAALVTLFLAI